VRALTRRLFYIGFAKEMIQTIFLNEPTGVTYKNLQRKLANPDYRFFNLHLNVLRECNIITKPPDNRKPGPTLPIHLIDQSVRLHKKYENVLSIPNLQNANSDVVKDRMLIFMLSVMEYNISNRESRFLWNSLKGFPYVSEYNVECNKIEQDIGMHLTKLLAQKTIKNKYILFKDNNLKYTIQEITRFTDALIASNNGEPILRPIEINGKLKTEREDQLLVDYIARFQALLLVHKYNKEYEIMARAIGLYRERENYVKFVLPQVSRWYKSTFGVGYALKVIENAYSNFIEKYANMGLDKRVERLRIKLEYLENYARATDRFVAAMLGEKYRATRLKYPLLVHTMESIVPPLFPPN
jgi:hypothetical protein